MSHEAKCHCDLLRFVMVFGVSTYKKAIIFSVLCKVMMERDFRNWDWDLIGSTLQVILVSFTRKLILF